MSDYADAIDAAVSRNKDRLLELSHRIHANPEIKFKEVQASAWLADVLESEGFSVQRGVGDLPTAFVAEMPGGRPGPTVAVLAEYDALEGIGHACGHNIIATAALGAALGLAPSMPQLPGSLKVIGTPAEEGGGGKAILLQHGVFDDVDAAMMIHPYHLNQTGIAMLANVKWSVTFRGKPAHAALAPHLGINALDSVRLAFAGVDALRQQVRSDVRIHGIVTHGGDAANIIPDRAQMLLVGRAADGRYLFDTLVPRLQNVLNGAALMTGAEVDVADVSPAYQELRTNPALSSCFEVHSGRLGRTLTPWSVQDAGGSTDMGNVSQRVPALHAMLAIDDEALPHTEAFREAARGARGDCAVLDGARILASVAADVLSDPKVLEQARRSFEER
ncbi:MAG: M20 family metallopeptidase [Trueperaceae bacterium]